MRPYRKMDKAQIAQTNKYNVLHCLIRGTPINRAAIAKRTDLSIPTVMSIIDDLSQKNSPFHWQGEIFGRETTGDARNCTRPVLLYRA